MFHRGRAALTLARHGTAWPLVLVRGIGTGTCPSFVAAVAVLVPLAAASTPSETGTRTLNLLDQQLDPRKPGVLPRLDPSSSMPSFLAHISSRRTYTRRLGQSVKASKRLAPSSAICLSVALIGLCLIVLSWDSNSSALPATALPLVRALTRGIF